MLLSTACGAAEPSATPTLVAATPGASVEVIAAARADVKNTMALYAAGQRDAVYEKAAAIYLDRIEGLEPALLKVDKNFAPVLEGDFKALRDGIKVGLPKADLDAIAARIDAELVRADTMLAPHQ
ncbi:MAG: hypothetical protein ACR2M0_15565 [Chloroflexia bacterium]